MKRREGKREKDIILLFFLLKLNSNIDSILFRFQFPGILCWYNRWKGDYKKILSLWLYAVVWNSPCGNTAKWRDLCTQKKSKNKFYLTHIYDSFFFKFLVCKLLNLSLSWTVYLNNKVINNISYQLYIISFMGIVVYNLLSFWYYI